MPDLRARATPALLLAATALAACGGAQRTDARSLAPRCEVQHELRGDDELTVRVEHLDGAWLVALRMRLTLAGGALPIEARGLGRVTRAGSAFACQVVESDGQPGAPRFDEPLCLDAFESLADVIADAEQSARPGETVVQEVRLRPRSRRARSRLAPGAVFRERAEITRDARGRIVRLVRSTDRGGTEEIRVSYPANLGDRCLPTE